MTESPPGLNIAPSQYHSMTSGLTKQAAKEGDDSLLVGASLTLDPTGENI